MLGLATRDCRQEPGYKTMLGLATRDCRQEPGYKTMPGKLFQRVPQKIDLFVKHNVNNGHVKIKLANC